MTVDSVQSVVNPTLILFLATGRVKTDMGFKFILLRARCVIMYNK